ncbi:DMT family transporter [Pacificimonas flava]|uniref:Permease of the drug/metabolite transporter (DMT) superfamily n=1 Tax=Pacificimonas flava TaxID=1234595 RepID=M2T6S6_9SPHN|nr:DMT family transporter [Pacificimonas flava]EMD82234.1 Permease of the drug/metabolite transporter (DMT) superfamily [Pacificimonas flava]MBB5280855.1 drug/metabolite transporter (DMT)-like permease [Pacificimonas flava]
MEPRHLLPLGIVAIVWGTTWYVIKTQIGVVPVEWSVAYRFLTAGAIMFGAAILMKRRLRYDWRAHLFFLGVGLFQFAGNFSFVYQASRYVTSGLIAVAFALLIVPNAILARLIFGHRVTARFVLGAVLGICGVALLFRQELLALEGSPGLVFGLGATILAVLCASAANVMQAAPFVRSYSMIGMLAWAMLYGAGIDVAIAWALRGPPVIESTPLYLGGVAYLAIFASAIAFLLYFNVIRQIGPAKAAYSGVVVPFVAMAISTLLEGYVWTSAAVLGGILTLGGLVVAISARS